MTKTLYLLHVYFNDQDYKKDYTEGLDRAIASLRSWFANFYINSPNGYWGSGTVRMSRPLSTYEKGYGSIMEELLHRNIVQFNSNTAWYLFIQGNNQQNVGGTLGGDVFGQTGRVPGVSFFDEAGLLALAEDKAWPGTTWTRDRALGAIVHELGHNLALLPHNPIADDGERPSHDPSCVMTAAFYDFPNCILEENGLILGGVRGNEIQALVDSGFFYYSLPVLKPVSPIDPGLARLQDKLARIKAIAEE